MSLDDIVDKLCGNFPEERKEGLENVKHFLTNIKTSNKVLSKDDGTKLWEGLFYAMWFQDKPLLQEALSQDMAKYLHILPTFQSQLRFVKAFFAVMSSKWAGLDKIRIDKFLMLVRDVVHELFVILKQGKWAKKDLSKFRISILKSILDHTKTETQLIFHFTDIYLQELKTVASSKLTPGLVVEMIIPFIRLLQSAPFNILSHVINRIFNDEYCKVPRNYGQIAKYLFQIGSEKDIPKKNRQAIYKLVSEYRAKEKGLPTEPELDLDSGSDIDDEKIEKAAKRLIKFNSKLPKAKKVKKAKMIDGIIEDLGCEVAF